MEGGWESRFVHGGASDPSRSVDSTANGVADQAPMRIIPSILIAMRVSRAAWFLLAGDFGVS